MVQILRDFMRQDRREQIVCNEYVGIVCTRNDRFMGELVPLLDGDNFYVRTPDGIVSLPTAMADDYRVVRLVG
jgi:hypothetical protein